LSNVLVIGAQNIDIFAKTDKPYSLRDSNLATISLAYGGVGRNICENLNYISNDVSFLTVFSDDAFSISAHDSLKKMGIKTTHSKVVQNMSNSIYLGILDDKNDLYLGLNDMEITKELNISFFKNHIDYINSFNFVVIDNNLSKDAIEYLLNNINKKVIMDAVSAKKVIKLNDLLHLIDVLKVNVFELNALSNKDSKTEQMNDLKQRGLKNLIVTDGEKEIYLLNERLTKTSPIKVENVINASGAGDAFLSGFVHGIINNVSDDEKLEYAKKMAYHTLLCDEATNKDITKEVLK